MGESPDRVERNEVTDGATALEGVEDDVDMGEFERDLEGAGVAEAPGSEDVGNVGDLGDLESPGDVADLADSGDAEEDRAEATAPVTEPAPAERTPDAAEPADPAEPARADAGTTAEHRTDGGKAPAEAPAAAPVKAAAEAKDVAVESAAETEDPAEDAQDPAEAGAPAAARGAADRDPVTEQTPAGGWFSAAADRARARAAADRDDADDTADVKRAAGPDSGARPAAAADESRDRAVSEDADSDDGGASPAAGQAGAATAVAVSAAAPPSTAPWSAPERTTQTLRQTTPPPPPPPPLPDAAPDGSAFGPDAAGANPETTSEALEILATLSRRPMTPLRRALKRVGLWGGLLCFLLAIAAFVQVLRPLPTPVLKLSTAASYTFAGSAPTLAWPTAGQSAVEVDGLGSLGDSGPESPVPIASVTKVMTAHLVLKDHPLNVGQQGPVIVVDQQAVDDYTKGHSDGESVMKVSKGEQLTEYQALQMLLIPSANNVARLLGRWDAGTDAAFVAKMQGEAAALGMSQTTYTDPSGLLDTTKSTANDQLKLAGVAIETPVFRQIVSTTSFSPPENGPTLNTNALIGQDGVIGIKTGSDSAALGCLMWAARTTVGGTTQTVLGVTLGQPALSPTFGILDNVMATSKKLLVSAEHVLQSQVLVKQGQVVGYVDDGEGGRTPLTAAQDVNVVGWSGTTVPVSLAALGGVLPHTGKAGEAVGYLVVGSGASAQRIPVTLQSDLAEPSFGARLTRLG